jgi:hypothetical protein
VNPRQLVLVVMQVQKLGSRNGCKMAHGLDIDRADQAADRAGLPPLLSRDPLNDTIDTAGDTSDNSAAQSIRARAENSHQPTRRSERKIEGFKSAGSAQRFLSFHAATYNIFNVQPTSLSNDALAFRASTMQTWREITAAA